MAANITFDVIARDRASKTLEKVGRQTETLGTRMKRFAPLAGAVAAAAVIKFGKDSVTAFAAAEESQKRLQFAFDKFPAMADTNIGALQKLNTALARKTKFDDDAIASGQATLAQFKLTGEQVKSVTPLLLDYASATGKDVPQAAQDVGKALLGNAKALKNIGISYKSTKDPVQDFANITALMREKVGGFADKEGKTAAGRAAILGNRFGELQETVGEKLMPVLSKLVDVGISVIAWIEENQPLVVGLVTAFAALGATVVIVNAATKAYVAVSKVVRAATIAWTGVQWALNAALTANPVGALIVAVAAMAAGIVILWQRSERFRTIVTHAFKTVALAVLGGLSSILGGIQNLLTAMGKMPGPFGAPFRAAAKAVGAAKEKVDDLRASVKQLGGKNVVIQVRTQIDDQVSKLAKATGVTRNQAARVMRNQGFSRGGFTGFGGVDEPAGIVHGREFVVNAKATAQNRALLEAINSSYPGYAAGGFVLPQRRTRDAVAAMQRGAVGTVSTRGANRIMAGATDAIDAAFPRMPVAPPGVVGPGGRVFPLPPGTYVWGRGPGAHGYDAQDLPVPSGTPVRAPVSGFARGVDLGDRSYGRYVQIASTFGRVILAHLSRLLIGAGTVRAGQTVGLSGTTGNSTGPHLHVEPSRILSFAKGGIIPEQVIGVGLSSGRGYRFGENGPETVTPGRGGGTVLNVTVNTGVGDKKAIAREVVDAVGAYLRAGGTLPPRWHTA